MFGAGLSHFPHAPQSRGLEVTVGDLHPNLGRAWIDPPNPHRSANPAAQQPSPAHLNAAPQPPRGTPMLSGQQTPYGGNGPGWHEQSSERGELQALLDAGSSMDLAVDRPQLRGVSAPATVSESTIRRDLSQDQPQPRSSSVTTKYDGGVAQTNGYPTGRRCNGRPWPRFGGVGPRHPKSKHDGL